MSSSVSHTSVHDTLVKLGLTSDGSKFVYNKGTRDISDLIVWKDAHSGVVFIENYYVGEEIYNNGDFRRKHASFGFNSSLERKRAAQRRIEETEQYITGKDFIEFGCGAGDYLRKAVKHTKSAVGVELERSYLEQLR